MEKQMLSALKYFIVSPLSNRSTRRQGDLWDCHIYYSS